MNTLKWFGHNGNIWLAYIIEFLAVKNVSNYQDVTNISVVGDQGLSAQSSHG